jgi:hypothetical protein
MTNLGATGLPLSEMGGGLLVNNLAPHWLEAARRAANDSPDRIYHHTEWPGPAPGSWDYSVFSSPTNPGNAVNVTSRCTIDLVYDGACQGNASCVLGVLSAGNAGEIDLSSLRLDDHQVQLGRTMHNTCVQSKVQSYFGAWSTAS